MYTITKKEQFIELDKINRLTENHRSILNENPDHIYYGPEGIKEIGLRQPLMVNGDFENDTIRGYCRLNGLRRLKRDEPDQFKKLFPRGIPCFVVTGATEAEIAMLRADHAQQRELKSDFEFVHTAVSLYRNGYKEKEIIEHLRSLYERFSKGPSAAESIKKYNALFLEGKRTEAIDLMAKTFHGTFQNKHKRLAEMPAILLSNWRAAEEGRNLYPSEIPNWYPEAGKDIVLNVVPVISTLWAGWQEDMKVKDENEIKVHSVNNVGPAFIAALKKVIEIQANESGSGAGTQAKAMSAKALKELASKTQSKAIKQTLMLAAGVKDVMEEMILAHDKACLDLELALSTMEANKLQKDIDELASQARRALAAKTANNLETVQS